MKMYIEHKSNDQKDAGYTELIPHTVVLRNQQRIKVLEGATYNL